MGQSGCLTCRLCGEEHRTIDLKPGDRALCSRCGALMGRGPRAGPDRALVFSVTGLALALPAFFLPLMSASLLGAVRISDLLTGVDRLWGLGMRLLSVLVFLCGGLLPLLSLATIALLRAPFCRHWQRAKFPLAGQFAGFLGHWAIPEVQVLALLVAIMKLKDLVHMTIGAGFWCYCGMALVLLLAQRSLEFEAVASP